ncbi:MAG: F0F1 ATP synthase subunit B, partial [Acidobacteriota bacterium]
SIFGGDLGNVLWTLLTFGLTVFVLGKFVWGPLQSMVAKREDFIRDSLEQAKADRASAEARLAEYEERLAEARAEATALVEEGRRDAEATRVRLEQEARTEADKMVERAKREISIARETAVAELYEHAGRAATDIAGRIVGRELAAADHEKLISDAIQELSSQSKPN